MIVCRHDFRMSAATMAQCPFSGLDPYGLSLIGSGKSLETLVLLHLVSTIFI